MTVAQTVFLLVFLLVYVLIGAFVGGIAESYFGSKDIGVFFFAWPILLVCVVFACIFNLGRKVGGRK